MVSTSYPYMMSQGKDYPHNSQSLRRIIKQELVGIVSNQLFVWLCNKVNNNNLEFERERTLLFKISTAVVDFLGELIILLSISIWPNSS